MIKKILIVDDSPVARKMLKKCIPDQDQYEIIEAADGKEGVDKFIAFSPEIVFLDLTMPVLDGYDALKQIKVIDKNAIVIILTADIQPKSISTVMECGAYTVIKKPAKVQSIKDIIQKADNKLKGIARITDEY